MARKPFPIRLDTTDIADIESLSKSLGIPKTEIIEDGLRAHIAKLKGYEAMDKGPPAKAKANTVPLKMSAGIIKPDESLRPRTSHKAVGLTGVRGWDHNGQPITR